MSRLNDDTTGIQIVLVETGQPRAAIDTVAEVCRQLTDEQLFKFGAAVALLAAKRLKDRPCAATLAVPEEEVA